MPTPREVFDRLSASITEGRWAELSALYAEDTVVEHPQRPPVPTRITGRQTIHEHFTGGLAASVRMRQHNVVVHVDGARFTPDEDSLTIEEGDLVLWNCPHATTIPFVIAGDDEFFDSSNLVNECGFSHAFGSPGEYRWRDAHGSGIGGVVRVSAPDGVGRADLGIGERCLRVRRHAEQSSGGYPVSPDVPLSTPLSCT